MVRVNLYKILKNNMLNVTIDFSYNVKIVENHLLFFTRLSSNEEGSN